ncbi:transposase [Agrobacterium rhizogenes]|nr:transposase [Rhizobium rhizogenes]
MGQAAYALQNRFAPLTTVLTDGINLGLTTMVDGSPGLTMSLLA